VDRTLIAAHLAQAERHVVEGARHIERQHEIIQELERDGHDTTAARELLAALERTQVLHLEGRDRLRSELAAL
jgi:hypothetical protein